MFPLGSVVEHPVKVSHGPGSCFLFVAAAARVKATGRILICLVGEGVFQGLKVEKTKNTE